MNGEDWTLQPQAQDLWSSPANHQELPEGLQREHSPAGTLSLDFQLPGPPDLGDDVLAMQTMVLWYGCPRKPT